MVLLAAFDALLLGEILGQHPAPVAIVAAAVNGADGAREGLDMMEILPGISAQRVEWQPPLGPRLVERMLEHRSSSHFRIDCRRNRHACLPLVSTAVRRPVERRQGDSDERDQTSASEASLP